MALAHRWFLRRLAASPALASLTGPRIEVVHALDHTNLKRTRDTPTVRRCHEVVDGSAINDRGNLAAEDSYNLALFFKAVLALPALILLALPLPAQQNGVQPMTANEIVEHMTARNLAREQRLHHSTSIRHYRLDYRGFPENKSASMEVEANFDAPGSKTFRVISQSGSKLLLDRVLKKLLESETDAATRHRNTDLNLTNYRFELAGNEVLFSRNYYILTVEPRVKSKYLYRGKVWVDAEDFALAQIDGEPAVNPSFMIKQTHIHHLYSKVGEFWFPQQNRTESKIRLGGTATLAIDYSDYKVTPASRSPASQEATHVADK